jgi:hypothetical protein
MRLTSAVGSRSEGERFVTDDVQGWASDVAATVTPGNRVTRAAVFLQAHSAGRVHL